MNIDISILENMSDTDYFSNKLTHIYFNDYVNNKSIDELIKSITKANENIITPSGAILKPKPILIHISSYGGELTSGLRLLSVFAMSSVPIATIIDNYSCSAATFLSINSHYRLINNYGFCIIHGYSVSGTMKKKQRELKDMVELYDSFFSKVIEMYKERTNFNDEELIELLQHDLLLDANFCLKKKIVDRIINIQPAIFDSKNINTNIEELYKHNYKYNNIMVSCHDTINTIDAILFEDNLAPVILHSRKDNCESNSDINKSSHKNDGQQTMQTTIFETFNMIPRILNIKSPTYAIIDGAISIDDLIPMLYCDYIFMYDYAYIICNILSFYNKSSILLNDNIKNTELLFNIIRKILNEKTKMTEKNIDDINNKFTIIDSKECLKLGLCHKIINYSQLHPK
jgi:ATP-dependent protease ClpP protease subunit